MNPGVVVTSNSRHKELNPPLREGSVVMSLTRKTAGRSEAARRATRIFSVAGDA
jgi:hypothetical protein